MADFNQAIKWLKEGKKVRRNAFTQKDFFVVSGGTYIYWKEVGGGRWNPDMLDYEATDWEIVICKNNNHDWEKHGCASPLKEYFVCKACGEEKFIYVAEEKTLSDEIFDPSQSGSISERKDCWRLEFEKVKECFDKIKKDFGSGIYNKTEIEKIINKHIGPRLA